MQDMQERRQGRARSRRKKRLKKSVKLTIAILVALLFFAGYVGSKYYMSVYQSKLRGEVGKAHTEKDAGSEKLDGSDKREAEYIVFDVGDGEAILVKTGSTEVLIDTGSADSSDKLASDVQKNISGKLDYVVLTGPSDTRIGGVKKLYSEIDVDNTIIGELGETKTADIKKAIGKNGTITKGKSTTVELDYGAVLSIFKPEVASTDIQDQSLMTAFIYGDTRFVALSDAGPEEESKLVGVFSNCDVLVLARNGADSSNKASLGERYTVASTKAGSGLPAGAVISSHNSIFTTAKSGNIKFLTNSIITSTDTPPSEMIQK